VRRFATTTRTIQIGFALGVFALWQLAASTGWVGSLVLPSFTASLASLYDVLHDRDFLAACVVTTYRIVIGFVISVPLGALIGFAVSEHPSLRKLGVPTIYFMLSVPQSIFIPLFILVFGTGDPQKIIFAVSHATIIVAVNTIGAIDSVPATYKDAARSFGASVPQTFLRVMVPAMLPALLTGIRSGLIVAVASVLFAEMYASSAGLGMLIMQWTDALQTSKAIGVVMLISLLTIVFNECLRVYERRLGRWQLGSTGH